MKKKRGRPALVQDPERRSIRLGKKDWQALADSTKAGSWSDRVSEVLASRRNMIRKENLMDLFEAYREWMLDDAGGHLLTDVIPSLPGFAKWSKENW